MVVVTVNVPLLAPSGMVRVLGTVATLVLLLASVTTEPPAGAGPVSVSVAVDGLPPTTELGDSDTADGVGEGTTVSVAVLVAPLVAEMVTAVCAVTLVVLIVKVADE